MKSSTSDLLAYYGQSDEEKVVLPDGYVPVEYLEGDGSQWLDTGIRLGNDTGFEVKTAVGVLGQADRLIFGSRDSGSTDTRNWLDLDANNVLVGFGSYYKILNNWLKNTQPHVYSIFLNGTRNIYVDGIARETPSGLTTQATQTGTAYLFCANINGSPGYGKPCSVYYLKVTRGIDLIMHLVPAIRLADMKPGMYDVVGNQFLVNQGTGADFITPIETAGYRRVQYIQGTNGTKLDTGVLGKNDDLAIESCFRYTSWGQYAGIYGAYSAEASNATRLILGTNNTALLFYLNTKASGGSTTVSGAGLNTWNTAYHDKDKVVVNGTTTNITNKTAGTALTTQTIQLWNAGTASQPTAFKYFRIYDKGDTVLCMLPVVRTSDSTPGFYNMVNGTFMTTAGLTYAELS